MATSDFWRELAAEFRSISDSGMLRADGDYIVGSGRPWRWELRGGATDFIRKTFETLARRGASEIANAAADLLVAWLEALRKEGLPNFRQGPGIGIATEINDDGSAGLQHMLGSIDRVCEASATFCRKLESEAIQTEFEEKQRNDPRNWSPLHQQVEAFKELKKLIAGPRLHIPEALVRDALAQQFGIKPEEVTWKQIQFEVSGLLSNYPAITVVPSNPIPDSSVQPNSTSSDIATAQAKDVPDTLSEPTERRGLRTTIYSPVAARKMEAYLEANGIGLTDFATRAGTTDRTLRSFRTTGRIKRTIFDDIAKAMGTTKDELLRP